MNKLVNILNSSICPSDEILQQYVENKLESPAKKAVENHLADCEICNDQVEGLQQMTSKIQIDRVVTELNQKVKQRAVKKTSKFIYFTYAVRVAAIITIFLLIGSAVLVNYFVRFYKTKTLAENNIEVSSEMQKTEQKKLTKTIEKLIKEEKINKEELKKNVLKNKNIENDNATEKNNLITSSSVVSGDENNNENISPVLSRQTSSDEQIINSESPQFIAETDSSLSDNISANDVVVIGYGTVKKVYNTENELISDEDDKTSEVKKDMALVSNKKSRKLSNAVVSSSKTLGSEKSDFSQTVYTEANDLYNAKNFTLSLNKLNAYDFTNTGIEEDAKFLKALCYIELRQNENARQILEQLSKSARKEMRKKAELKLNGH